jgi:hypothetical protein
MAEFMARVRRTQLPGSDEELISLELIRDTDVVELHEGDEFVTLTTPTDPFQKEAPHGQ